MIAAVRVRGRVSRSRPISDTLRMLQLYKSNYCVLLEENPRNMGMLKKVKDFITWGSVEQETVTKLKNKSNKKYFKLQPPKKGYGRAGIKRSFNVGGALGDRKEKMSDLITRML